MPLQSLVFPSQHSDSDYNTFFNIGLNGSLNIKMDDNGGLVDIKNHFGDFEAVSKEFFKATQFLAKLKLGKEINSVPKVYSEHVEIAEGFEKLIEFCIDSLVKIPDLTLLKKFKLFQVC